MDAWARLFEDEREALDFLLQEEFKEEHMEQSIIRLLQDEAYQASNILPGSEATAHVQVIMLAEIALQLAGINEKLEKIAGPGEYLDCMTDSLNSAASWLRAIADKEAK